MEPVKAADGGAVIQEVGRAVQAGRTQMIVDEKSIAAGPINAGNNG